MNGRELVILLLGLAIVAVVLRGLYVAINARRGQIKLAIDKNIPQNVDLESLKLAELPGGGARVVIRSLEEVNRQNNVLDLAETKAQTVNLADAEIDEHIPVLMDAVELSEPVAQEVDGDAKEEEYQSSEEIEISGKHDHCCGNDYIAQTQIVFERGIHRRKYKAKQKICISRCDFLCKYSRYISGCYLLFESPFTLQRGGLERTKTRLENGGLSPPVRISKREQGQLATIPQGLLMVTSRVSTSWRGIYCPEILPPCLRERSWSRSSRGARQRLVRMHSSHLESHLQSTISLYRPDR